MTTSLTSKPRFVRPSDASLLQLRGEVRHQILCGDDTGGALSLAFSEFACGSGAPLHAHTREDEFFFIERGEFSFSIGGQTHRVGAGDFVFAPRLIPHSHRCESDGALLVGIAQTGFEHFLAEMAAAWAQNEELGADALRALAANYGVFFDGFDALDAPVSKPIVLRAHEGECLQAFGDQSRVLLASSDVQNRFCVLVGETPSLNGPPLHVHEHDDEIFVILQGRYEFQVGDARLQASPGDVLFAPRGVPHAFRVVSGMPGRFLVFSTPGGFDHFFRAASQLFDSGLASPQKVTRLAAAHGIQFLPPTA